MNYTELEANFTAWAQAQADLRAAIVVGSRARIDPPPDQWSDLDLILFTTDMEKYAADRAWLDQFGAVTIAVLEHSPRGDAEWLIVYESGCKFDVLLAPVQENGPIGTTPYDIVLAYGARVLFDKSAPADRLNLNISVTTTLPTAAEFSEAMNAAWLTALRTAKFIARGDLWRAKLACDSQLKAQVLAMLEWHALANDPQRRVWHDGRDITRWADRRAVMALPGTFAAYDAADLRRALFATLDLYRWLSIETAQRLGLTYPVETQRQITVWLQLSCRISHASLVTHYSSLVTIMPNSTWLIYGANGYTGELIAREAVKRGLRPILAGRNRAQVAALATALNLEYRIAALDDRAALESALREVAVVVHCAGPFSHTSKPMIDACLRTRTHYLDITGEVAVFEAAAARDLEATAAGIMVLPGVGFDVVPTDCTAAYLKAQLPTATHLTLAFRGLGRSSRGTTLTALEITANGGMIRRNGQLTPVPSGWKTRSIDFGDGPQATVTIPWGDVSTAFYSTGIPNIEVYTAFPPMLIGLIKFSRVVNPLLSLSPVQALLRLWIHALPSGPGDARRARSRSAVWGEVRDDAGHTATLRLVMAGGYPLTVLTTLDIVQRVRGGHAPIGFQTPSRAYGLELIFGIEGVRKSG